MWGKADLHIGANLDPPIPTHTDDVGLSIELQYVRVHSYQGLYNVLLYS